MAEASHPEEYPLGSLTKADLDPDPFRQFARWFEQARTSGAADPHAMTLATATRDGIPSARMVLLNAFDARGFVFYTNYESRKGRDLAQNPYAALVFYWPELRRQVRAAGRVERLTPAESDAYFRRRPAGSRLGAWASHQSEVIADREALERRVEELAAEFTGREIPRPPYWGGCRVVPDSFEFWQSRPNRLHDRFRYSPRPDGGWRIERLAP
jgi:pyridoxamine 5'-phosphate oxidase